MSLVQPPMMTLTQQLITGVKVGINELYHVDLDGSLAETVTLAPADQLVVSAPAELEPIYDCGPDYVGRGSLPVERAVQHRLAGA